MMGVPELSSSDLAAKYAITEVLSRYCRALDRMDRALALACWVDGGTDDHSPLYAGSADGFLDWLWPVHAGFLLTRHTMSNVIIDLKGDCAGVESYVAIVLRTKREDGVVDILNQGRYLDDFERHDGVWAIRHRRTVTEWSRIERPSDTAGYRDRPLVVASSSGGTPIKAARDRTDPSYAVLNI